MGNKTKEIITKKPKEWSAEFWEHKYLIIVSLIFLIVALLLGTIAGNYVDGKNSLAVKDIILDNIPTLNLTFLYVYGSALITLLLFIYPLFFEVKSLHRAISQFALLNLIRSFFISLTHLAIPVSALVYTTPAWFIFIDFKNALFFSQHTATPFLGFLLFKNKKIGIFFLIGTIVMALTVLFMHVHYSIDVFAALFIAYGSYNLGNWLFKKINHY